MHDKTKENDWKIFLVMVPELRERYLRDRNEQLAAILSDDQLSATERFWVVEEHTRKIAKILHTCFVGHTRSKMEFFMIVLIINGLMIEEDLAKYSEELRERMKPHIP